MGADPPYSKQDATDIGGHTLDELVDYLDSGRTPVNSSIEASPEAQNALDSLARLRQLTTEMVDDDLLAASSVDENWVQSLVQAIMLDARAGRTIPLSAAGQTSLGITEGAVRGVIRAAETVIPDAVVGRSRLRGDVTTPGEPVTAEVEVSVVFGRSIAQIAKDLRREIASRLATHTELKIVAIDIVVQEIEPRGQGKPS